MKQDVKPVYLDREAVARFVSLSEPSVQKLVREKKFPQPRLISAHRVAWLISEVEEWARERPVASLLPPPSGGGSGRNRKAKV
ncbi:helix-turn-helix transcriptional regulator [Paraburkholderia sp. BR14320]|uniref:helix-turn-helix transcriptional regulator n=1 Tax=unclassified Paraburkholderia TaxID=2615204 RepID=UPI0034CE8E1A